MSRPVIIAHRGASAYAPENTLPAFDKAVCLDAEGIELDVRMTKDGYLVVIHDETIERTSNGFGRMIEMTFEALRQYDYGKWFSPAFAGQSIPLLQEVLCFLAPWDGILNIEIKNKEDCYPGIEEALLKLLRRNDYLDRVIISSFHHESIRRLRSLSPSVRTALLYSFSPKLSYKQSPEYGVGGIHPHYRNVSPRMIQYCHENHIKSLLCLLLNRSFLR